MAIKYLDELIEQFTLLSERWSNQIISGVNKYAELDQKVSEREFNLVINLTTISVAFVAIVIPLSKDDLNSLLRIVITGLSVVVFLGIGSLCLSIIRDKRIIPQKEKWERNRSLQYLRDVVQIRNLLQRYKEVPSEKLEEEVAGKIKNYFGTGEELEEEVEKENKKYTDEASFKLLKFLIKGFWFFFIISFVCLLVWIGNSLFTNKKISASTGFEITNTIYLK